MRRWWVVVGLVCSSGCATLFSGGPETLTFTSNPEGVEVLLDGLPLGRTPLSVQVDRQAFGHRIVTYRARGLETRQFPLQKSLNVVAIFNLFSLLSWATDATTGALITYAPSSYYIELRPANRGAPPPGRYDRYNYIEKRALWFTLVSHEQLKKQIARQRGPHLEALAELLEVEPEPFAAALVARSERLLSEPYPHRLFRELSAIALAVR